MSGTSLDGADAVLGDLTAAKPQVLGFCSSPFPPELRQRLLRLCAPGADSLDDSGEASIALAAVYANVVGELLARAKIAPAEVRAVGCHGQTVRHRPARGFTIQLNDPARLAELTGIDVVADFRRRDMAAGGQGAPLVPVFHEAVFRDPRRARAVVNIGGIGNITWIRPDAPTIGFDCGPGNVMLDAWSMAHQKLPFDEDGRWASSGRADAGLLARFMEEPYLQLAPPKSTGRELFDLAWLEPRLPPHAKPADVQATLAEFTAATIVDALDRFCPRTEEIYVAGGGARNPYLMERIRALAARPVAATDALGVPSGQVEPLAFAWLAMKCIRREPVSLAAVTGAKGPRILGAIYPA